MKEIVFKGCATAIVTPFNEENEIDYALFQRLVNFQIEKGIHAIVVCGTTGEAATLSQEEKQAIIAYCVKVVNGRVPVIAGVGSNNTKAVIENEKFAEKVGVNGLLAVTPYYNKTTQAGLVEHFTNIAQNTNLPILLYNVPSRTGVDILPETYAKLSKVQNIVATKEASGDISKVVKIRNLCGDQLGVYAGNDDQIIPFLSLGGLGVISVLSNVMPAYTVQMIESFWKQEIKKAARMQIEIAPFITALFKEVNPIPVKAALELIGFPCGKPRLPLVECSDALKKELEQELRRSALYGKNFGL